MAAGKIDRRKFIKAGAIAANAAAVLDEGSAIAKEATGPATAQPAPTICFNGAILTMEGDAPDYVKAVAVKDGKIVHAGSKAHALARLPGATQVVHSGRAMMPGFIDSCGHFTLFTAVVLAVVESAVDLATQKLAPRKADMRAFERIGWTEIVNQAWTMRQVYSGMIAAVEAGNNGAVAALRGKTVVAELAEACMLNLGRVVGGGAFSRSAPFGQWAQDVRALGFLRPPWGLAFDQLFDLLWPVD